MSYPNPNPGNYYQENEDTEHLRLLSVFHYLLGGLTMLVSCFFLIHVALGIGMLLHPSSFGNSKGGDLPPAFAGWLFTIAGGVAVLAGWGLGGMNIYAGKCLKERRSSVFITVVAALNCIHMPLGTALGVFTIVVMSRPSVKALFAGRSATSTWFEEGREPRPADFDVPAAPHS